jgi:hypothetical protein
MPTDSSNVDFILTAWEGEHTMSTAATLDSGVTIDILEVDAVGVYYINESDIRKVFRYDADSYDVDDISSTDIRYYTFMDQWPESLLINPVNAMMDATDSLNAMIRDTSIASNRNLVKHDFLRYLAKKLFNTPQGVDLFNNESELITTLNTLGNTSFQDDISGTLWKYSTDSTDTAALATTGFIDGLNAKKATTNDFTGEDNVSRELFQQILSKSPSRFSDISGAGILIDGTGTAYIPINSGDSISYKFILNPAADQNALTGVDAFGGRSYQIKLIVTDDSATNTNTVVTD